jgi:hypothetical protein
VDLARAIQAQVELPGDFGDPDIAVDVPHVRDAATTNAWVESGPHLKLTGYALRFTEIEPHHFDDWRIR